MPLHSASRLWRVDTATSLAESSLAVMCGIVGIVPHAGVPAAPDITKIRDLITAARAVADGLGAEADASPAVLDGLGEVARSVGAAADATRGAAGVLPLPPIPICMMMRRLPSMRSWPQSTASIAHGPIR